MLINKRYMNLPVRSGATKHILTFSTNGRKVREFEIELAADQPEFWVVSDVSQYRGQELKVTSPTLPPELLARLEQVDEIKGAEDLYAEKYRPRFHFSPKRGYLQDANGLVYHQGEYHLFYQHNPYGTSWANMHWGHATSTDLLHWEELGEALEPDELGPIFSGSAVVDWDNTSGFQSGSEPPLVCIYTSAGGYSAWAKDKLHCQSIAYSNDRGRSWTKYDGNPVIDHIVHENRDPKVFWHKPTRQWVMVLYLDKNDFGFFVSPDLKQWERTDTIQMPGTFECPDLFELPVDGNHEQTRWVLWGNGGNYLLGDFDGVRFVPDGGVQAFWTAFIPNSDPKAFWLAGRSLAAQTWNDIPPEDGRRIQTSFMPAKLPGMAFASVMTFPTELTLRTTAEGTRLFGWPVMEIAQLHEWKREWHDLILRPGENPLQDVSGEAFDITAEFEVAPLEPSVSRPEFGFVIGEEAITYDPTSQNLGCQDKRLPLPPENNAIRLRILVDHGVLEIFGNDGARCMVISRAPSNPDHTLAVFSRDQPVRLPYLEVCTVKTFWPANGNERDN